MPTINPPLTPIVDTVTGQVTEIGRLYLRTLGEAVGALAPTDARYWLGTSSAGLSAEQNLGALASGYLKIAVAIGVATPSTVTTVPQADVTGLVTDLAAKAPLASPALTGTPTAPTAAAATNTTQIATTAMVQAAIAAGGAAAGSTRCAAYHSTTQSIADATFTAATFDSEAYDVTGVHSTGVNPSRFTIPAGAAGCYRISAVVSFAAHATGQRILKVQKNGADFNGNGYITGSTGGTWITGMSLTIDCDAADGDYFEVVCYQNSGGALNIGGTLAYTMNRCQIARVA